MDSFKDDELPPRNDRQEPCDNAKNDASHAQTRQEIQSKATLLFDRTNLTSESEWHRQDKTRLCHIHSNPSSQGGGQVLEKRNSCTDTCMTRRLVVNSWQMPLAIKPAHASRHATCHSTHYRPANAAVQCLPFLSRLNVRCDVLRECLQKCLYQGSGSTG